MPKSELILGSVHHVVFSPNGKHIVAGYSTMSRICMWNVETGATVGMIPASNLHSYVNSIAFSNDGKRVILGSEDGRVRVWDSELRQSIAEALHDDTKNVCRVAISRDGSRVASVSSVGFVVLVRIWDAQTGVQIGKLQHSYNCSLIRVSFSPNGRRLVSGHADGILLLWDLETFKLIGDPVKAHTDDVSCVVFSFDGLELSLGRWIRQSGCGTLYRSSRLVIHSKKPILFDVLQRV